MISEGLVSRRPALFRNLLLIILLAVSPACSNAQSPEAALVPKLEKLAAKGNAEAIYHLGMAYHVGIGVAVDKGKALADFRKAAELGDPLAAYKLGCYYDGQGEGLVEGDPALALKYKLVAAEAGYALAQQDVASLYARQGKYEQAGAWLKKAADQGWGDALIGMASVYNGNNGLRRDAAVMDAYFRLFLQLRDGGEKAQRDYLAQLENGMTAEEKSRADTIVKDYKAAPTPLTIKGLSGAKAAETLVKDLS